MIDTIIIEDEIFVRAALKKMLKIVAPNINVVGETGYVLDAVNLIKNKRPTLVFMDIELEDGTGFDVLKQLKNTNFKIIFTTAYNQYAIKAFKFSATDYLLKPIDPTELQEAVNRALAEINTKKEHQELLNVLKNNIEKETSKIVIKTTEQRYVLNLNDIIHLEANGAYTNFITKTDKIIVSKNLKYYQDLLDSNHFIRCHQSHLINTKHIVSIDKSGALKMSDNSLIAISTRKKAAIIQLVNKL